MKRFHTVKQTRKQAEQSILTNMRKILHDLEAHKQNKAQPNAGEGDATHQRKHQRQDEEKIDREHVMSIVSRFTALKRAIKF